MSLLVKWPRCSQLALILEIQTAGEISSSGQRHRFASNLRGPGELLFRPLKTKDGPLQTERLKSVKEGLQIGSL